MDLLVAAKFRDSSSRDCDFCVDSQGALPVSAKNVEIFFLKTVKSSCNRKEVNGVKEQILAVQRMQDYIEAHLNKKIGRRVQPFC